MKWSPKYEYFLGTGGLAGLGMHEVSGTNMGPFWTEVEAVFGLAVSSSQGGLGYRVYV